MITAELESGTKSFSNVASDFGHYTLTIDNDKSLSPDICIDILKLDELPRTPNSNNYDMIWASPPCTTFSVASISTHWTGGSKAHIPKTEACKLGLLILDQNIKIIAKELEYNPKCIFYLENPRGVMRKVIDKIFNKYNIYIYRRVTITYCQYGDSRMKPTDIWTNDFNWVPRPRCKNGDKCHESAPRGSKTGTQGLKNAKFRGVIPKDVFIDIFKHDFYLN